MITEGCEHHDNRKEEKEAEQHLDVLGTNKQCALKM